MALLSYLKDLYRHNKLVFLILFVSSIALGGMFLDKLNVDNVQIDGNTISTTNTDGDLILSPDGTGGVSLPGETSSRALILDANGDITSSVVTDTELTYLDGVTSNLQTQIDAKSDAGDLTTHTSATTSVHGIADTSNLVTLAGSETLTNKTITASGNTLTIAIDDLSDVDTTTATPTLNQVLTWDNTNWVPQTPSSGASTWDVVTETTTATAAANEFILADTSGGTFVITLPDASTNTDERIAIKKTDSSTNILTIATTPPADIENSSAYTISAQNDSIYLVSDGTDWFIIASNFEDDEVESTSAGLVNYVTTAGDRTSLTSIALTAGKWDISAVVLYYSNGATTAVLGEMGVSTTDGNSSTGLVAGDNWVWAPINNTNGDGTPLEFSGYTVDITSDTTYYLKGRVTSSITNVQVGYRITATRIHK